MEVKTQLTEEDKENILELWGPNKTPPSLKEMTELIAPGQNLDGHSKLGREIRTFLASRNLKYSTTKYQKQVFTLTEEQKLYIRTNSAIYSFLEIARDLFDRPGLTNLDIEARAIAEFIKEENLPVPGTKLHPRQNDRNLEEYRPPSNTKYMVRLLNNAFDQNIIDERSMSNADRKKLNSLINHFQSPRFRCVMNQYTAQWKRDLLEKEFCRHVWDKDVTIDEINLYISLCIEFINQAIIQRHIEILNDQLERLVNDDGKTSISLAQSINTKTKEYDDSVKRQQKLTQDLTGKRTDRMRSQIEESGSVLALINVWKNKEERDKLVKIAQQKKKLIANEVDRLEGLDEYIARVVGASKNEAING